MSNYKHQLSKRVKEITGKGMEEFCKKYLDTDIKAFQYRLRHRRCYPNEIIYISWVLGESVEDLFGEDFKELMRSHGPEHITKKLKDLFNKADKKQQKTYLQFIGVDNQAQVFKPQKKSEEAPIEIKPVVPEVFNGNGENKLIIDEVGLMPKPAPKSSRKLSDYLEDIDVMR